MTSTFYDFSLKNISGKPVRTADYSGNVLLVVNTASECGYTPQYEGLEKLHEKYSSKGFLVLGFPSNDFGGQEPGTNEQIASFCITKFGVKFPLFEKGPVKGENKQEFFKYLTEASDKKGEIKWNFEKFLVDRTGKVVGRFESNVAPDSPELTQAIENALGTK
ncbi:MAG: glutathione peroxidase [Bacteriovoracia bacterium]